MLTRHERLLRLEKATAKRKIERVEEQTKLLERFSPDFRERHIKAARTGALVAVDTFQISEAHPAKTEAVLSDNGRESSGRPDRHSYELFLELEEIEPRTTRVKGPTAPKRIDLYERCPHGLEANPVPSYLTRQR